VQKVIRITPAELHQGPAKDESGGIRLASLPPLSLYVHVPWCIRKCPYCDFNSHELNGELPEKEYLAALRADLEQALPMIWGRQIHTIFIGGGTPSLLSASTVDSMLAMFRAYLNLWPDAEITMEANPGTVEAQRFRDFAASGINRVSLGIQSFDDEALRVLGRIHDAAQARSAIEAAQNSFPRVNLDLMFALPGQTLESCERDLKMAMAFGTEHLSLYNLTLEPNTVFAKYPPGGLPDDDMAASMQERVAELAAGGGWQRYEVSAYARDGAQSRHNINYWEFGDYLGIGPGAHGKLSFPDRIIRQSRLKQPGSWMTKALSGGGEHIADEHEVQRQDLPFEFMLNALRLKEGVAAAAFEDRTGIGLAAIVPLLNRAVDKGLLDPNPSRIRATPLGWQFLNDLQSLFLD